LSWSNSQFLCHQSSRRSFRTFLSSRRSRSHYYAELTIWHEFFVNVPLDMKENDEHALDFAPLSNLFRSPWVWAFPLGGLLLCLRIITVNPALVTGEYPGQEGCIVAVRFVGSIAKSHQDRYTTPNKRT
jgi:hypothetical protein